LPQPGQKCVPSERSWQFQQTSGGFVNVGAVLIKCFSKTPQWAQKKWLAGAAANHWSGQPAPEDTAQRMKPALLKP
jgi:hypothetical protein